MSGMSPRPPDQEVEFTDGGFRTMVVSRPQMRDRGWQIDRLQMDELDRDGDYRFIPSPGRSENPDGWVFDTVACVPPAQSVGSRQIRPGFGQVA